MEFKDYHFPTDEELEQMRNVDIRTVDKSTLVDIKNVKIDETLPLRERMLDYLRQIKNPYCYLCNGVVVKAAFSGKTTLEECVARYCRSKMQ